MIQIHRHLVALAFVGLCDAISYMMVTPSLIFYVLQNGGTRDQYGFILSAFSFSSFCGKPVFGRWSDATKKYRSPYFASIGLASIGGLVYFAASIFGPTYPKVAVWTILAGRLLGGFGAANQALGFAYMATVTPPEKQTQANTLLSMTRILGMAAGPGFNALLGKIDFQIWGLKVDPLNFVGILLAILNSISLAVLYFLLEEPPQNAKDDKSDNKSLEHSVWTTLKSGFRMSIVLPIFVIFVVNSGFQLIETGFAPAAKHGLGWGPVGTSTVLGGVSVIICAFMILVFYLSSHDVQDHVLVGIGLTMYAVGGTLMYELWVVDAPVWHYVFPIALTVSGFPFVGSSNRSIYTRAVEGVPELQNSTASMQALLSMFASVAGFVTPGFVASFVLRTPEEVDASKDNRELSYMAWYVPILSLSALAGLVYVRLTSPEEYEAEDSDSDDERVSERTSLLRRISNAGGITRKSKHSSVCPKDLSKETLEDMLDPRIYPHRMKCCELMGLQMLETKADKERAVSLALQHKSFKENLEDAIEQAENEDA